MDQSPDAKAIEYIKMDKLSRLNFKKDFDYTASAKASYDF
jgi:hypothetical protein